MKKNNVIIKNKNIYKYIIDYEIDAGIVLLGWEVKSLRYKKVDINNSNIIIKNNEIYLIDSKFNLNLYKEKKIDYSTNRIKKLLLNKKEIYKLYSKLKNKIIYIFPIYIFWNNNYAKLKIGIGKKNNNYKKKNKLNNKKNILNYLY
ncbi:ssrA-binding protein [endosymbiont of Euscepes postfasciatus]|uniref:SsrA-binding protein n=1 Tax=endosymbiont of Euscepes postfasciatus TaxID=650377 RepID=UPI000DC6D8F2|nr:SsrA-binding protein [endosymbiont of Euscepes postfasciatus]BBA84746.1 ssrA-binding protein [endosymbiont of Euscepes postfasciatus]